MVLDDAKITTPYRISMTYPLVEQNTNLGLTILECRQAFSAASTYIIDCESWFVLLLNIKTVLYSSTTHTYLQDQHQTKWVITGSASKSKATSQARARWLVALSTA
jgi:hypothetical protein